MRTTMTISSLFAIGPGPASSAIAERIGWVLLHSLWQFALLGLAAAAIQRMMRPCSSSARCRMLLTILLMMTAGAPLATWRLATTSPSVGEPRSKFPAPNPETALAIAPMPALEPSRGELSALATTTERLTKTATDPGQGRGLDWRSAGADWRTRLEDQVRPWLAPIATAWGIGALLCAIRPIWGWRTARRWRRSGVSEPPIEVRRALERMAERLGVRRGVELLRSSLAPVPMVVGCLRPAILLPASVISGLPASQIEAILAHELAHLRRRDDWVNLLQVLAETIFFYHPAVWGLCRRIRNERENCCDDLAAAAIGSRLDYGRALLALEEKRGPATAAGLAIQPQGSSLLARIRRLAEGDDAQARSGIGVSIAVAALVMLTSLGIGYGAWARPQAPAIAVEAVEAVEAADPPQDAEPKPKPTPKPQPNMEANSKPWIVRGRVVDGLGQPMEGADIVASCGIGSLRPTGKTKTDPQGRYELNFGPGVSFEKSSPQTQYATISVHKDGFFEQDLHRQGGCVASLAPVADKDLKSWGVAGDRIILPDAPLTLNFTMLPAARVSGTLVDEQNRPIADYSIALTGKDLPPSSSALAAVRTDRHGRFELSDIPTTFAYQFAVRQKDLKPPWDDSWASPPLVFEDPGDRDFVAVDPASHDRIAVKSFALKLISPGRHEREALKQAAAGKTDWQGRTRPEAPKDDPRRLAADELTLILRNNAPGIERIQASTTAAVGIPDDIAKRLLARGVAIETMAGSLQTDKSGDELRISGRVSVIARTAKREWRFRSPDSAPAATVKALFVLPKAGTAEPLNIQFFGEIRLESLNSLMRLSLLGRREPLPKSDSFTAMIPETRVTVASDGVLTLEGHSPTIFRGNALIRANRFFYDGGDRVQLNGDVTFFETTSPRDAPPNFRGRDMEMSLDLPEGRDLSNSSSPVMTARDLDLTGHSPRRREEAPEIWAAQPNGREPFAIRPGVFSMPLWERIWLYYATASNRFYAVAPNPNGPLLEPLVFGPFQGDPFERWPLIKELADRLRTGQNSDDALECAARMLMTGNRRLANRALYLMAEALGPETILQRREEYVFIFQTMLKRHEAFLKDGQSGDIGHIRGLIRETQAEADFHALDLPDSIHRRPHADERAALAAIPAEAWGDAVDGLRAALVLDSPPSAKEGFLIGQIAIENVGDRDIRFASETNDGLWRLGLSAENGKPLPLQRAHSAKLVSRSAQPDRVLLKPGERVFLRPAVSLKAISTEKKNQKANEAETEDYVTAQPGRYAAFAEGSLGARLWQRDPSGIPRRLSPAKGEWSGVLKTGRTAVALFVGP